MCVRKQNIERVDPENTNGLQNSFSGQQFDQEEKKKHFCLENFMPFSYSQLQIAFFFQGRSGGTKRLAHAIAYQQKQG